jgi:hypothetical protein
MLRIVARVTLALACTAAPALAQPASYRQALCEASEGLPAGAFDRGRFLVVELTQPPVEVTPPSPMTQAYSQKETVIIDGVVMELPRWVIRGQIQAGVFIPVYAGTTIPLDLNDCFDIFGFDCL